VKPFFAQHPVRGLFGDPRIGPGSSGQIEHSIHFGVDISASDGTAVYATLTGWVSIHPLHWDTVMVSDGSGRVFEYWHVAPTLKSGHAIAYVTVIGHIEAGCAHVHFAERRGDAYLNPLRAGALGPYVDRQAPLLVGVFFERGGAAVAPALSGNLDVVVEAYDLPAITVPAPWEHVRLTPALVRWRLAGLGAPAASSWQVAYEVRGALPTTAYAKVFADGTRENRTYRVGRYRFLLMRHPDTARLKDGIYKVDVSISDIRGNTTNASVLATVGRV
jgi:hypothetical protein